MVGGMMSCCKDIIRRLQIEVVNGRWLYQKSQRVRIPSPFRGEVSCKS